MRLIGSRWFWAWRTKEERNNISFLFLLAKSRKKDSEALNLGADVLYNMAGTLSPCADALYNKPEALSPCADVLYNRPETLSPCADVLYISTKTLSLCIDVQKNNKKRGNFDSNFPPVVKIRL